MAVDIGTGTTVTFGTSGITANITDVGWSGLSRESVPTSHMGTTGGMTYTPADLYDPGELTLEVQFDPDKNYEVDIARVAETITVTFPLASGQSTASAWSATGFITGIEWDDPLEGLMTGTITCKMSGAITTTPST